MRFLTLPLCDMPKLRTDGLRAQLSSVLIDPREAQEGEVVAIHHDSGEGFSAA